jgi:hypothetical protein
MTGGVVVNAGGMTVTTGGMTVVSPGSTGGTYESNELLVKGGAVSVLSSTSPTATTLDVQNTDNTFTGNLVYGNALGSGNALRLREGNNLLLWVRSC